MEKPKIYLDTSVVSYLDQQDAPERMAETRRLWEKIKTGAYEIVISNVVSNELANCEKAKQIVLAGYLRQIPYILIHVDDEMVALAEQIVDFKILKQKSFDDCQHIAAAIVADCDAIVSWNFKHLVNPQTMKGVKVVTALRDRRDLLIYTPSSLIDEDNEND
ncbi:hypothetical protein AGMMS49959_08900 [Planctomycetales bacterium]|nr:hypothetical protein AGMMS49959_08900 [Planctomycetales bacterium]